MASNQPELHVQLLFMLGQLVDSDYHCNMERRELLALIVFGTACM